MTTNTPVRLLELAREVRLPAGWLKREADAGRIPHLRVGRTRLFDLDSVRRVLSERAANSEGVPRG